MLTNDGYSFYSETDTEVIAKILEKLYDGDMYSTIEKMLTHLVGAYALALVDRESPDTLYGAKLGSPMIV